MQLLWGRGEAEMRLGRLEKCGYNRQNRYRLTPGFVVASRARLDRASVMAGAGYVQLWETIDWLRREKRGR
jgi:hypothetical protein